MHGTDSYLKVTWRKSGELENDQCSNGVVFPAGNLLRPIPRLNPTPGEDIDQLRRQGRALANSSILHVRADHSGCQGAFWLNFGTLCSLKRLV